MANYSKINVGSEPRVELHDTLGLTGAEISFNALPAGAGVPFVHAHKENEEIYIVTSGSGKAIIDGKEIVLSTNDVVRVAPAADRQFSASESEGISYICIQVKENSLTNYTMTDAVMK